MNVKIKARGKLKILLPLIFSVLIAGVAYAEDEERQADPIQQDKLEAGKKVYFKRCVWCHGVEGVGDGPSHDRLFTKPRNFTQGTFKIRWTDSGELPRDQDLINTVTHGLPGSAMPSWAGILSKDEIEAVVQFVKSLVQDREFSDEDETMLDTVTELGPNPWGATGPYYHGIPQEAIDEGKKIMVANKCFECHGGEGRGDGNPTMEDDWGFPILAANWQHCWNFRGSRRNHYDPFNVARAVSTGLNGTPMPNFKDKINIEDRWKLAAFVNSLCPRKKIDKLTNKPIPDFLISVKYTDGEIASKISDPMWQAPDHDPKIIERSEEQENNPRKNYIALSGQITFGERNFKPKADNLWVSARWNKDQGIYYLVEYDNRFLSTDAEYPEAVAIQFPAKLQDLFGAEKPYFIFGDSKKPVDLWKASLMPKDYSATNAPKEEGYQLDVTVEELNGNGYNALNPKETEPTVKVVDAIFHQGRVKVMFQRALTTDGDMDVQIPAEEFIPVAFMQWAGWDKEIDEHMAVSTWYYTILEPPVDTGHMLTMSFIMGGIFVGLQGWLVWMTNRTRKMYADGKVIQDERPF
ncbi:MAG TPA: c-type cytochrome [Candidatus Marinimicrobia bacterium]|nr:c-type cytochrome [Candidatus Neomarinimicrobiota bacterium]